MFTVNLTAGVHLIKTGKNLVTDGLHRSAELTVIPDQ